MARHFDPYFDLQMLGLKTVLSNAHNKNTEKLLQDYLTFIPEDNIQPLITIVSNNGFEFL